MIRNRLLLLLAAVSLTAASCGSRDGDVLEIRSEADLSGLTLSCSSGNYYEHKYSARKDLSLFVTNSEADAVQAVRQGLADVFVTDEVALSGDRLKELGMKKAFRGEDAFDVAYAVRKGDAKLLEQLNAFITSAKADGTLDAVISHWVEGTEAVPFPDGGETSGEPLRCVLCINIAPASFLGDGGRWDGMDPEIIRRFARWAGRSVEFVYQDLGSGIIALQTGQADVIASCLFVTEERKKSVDFSTPYYVCHPGFFVRDHAQGGGAGLIDRLQANLVTEGRWKLITSGLLETLKITLFAILLGTVLGAAVCAMLRSRRRWIRRLAELYGAFIQGIPTLVLLLIMFYVVFAHAGFSGTAVAIVTFALCFAWSSGSIFHTAISSVPKGQTEAGLSLGFTPLKTFTGIVFPQALQKALPLYSGECVSLLKSTSIVGYIAIMDLTRASDLIRSRTFDALIPLLIITVVYFILAWLIRLLLNLFLKK